MRYIVVVMLLILPWFNTRSFAQRDEHISYLFPIENSRLISKNTSIIFRFKSGIILNNKDIKNAITVIGEDNRLYTGKAELSKDKRTVIFKSHQLYDEGELITVRFEHPALQNGIYQFQFSVTEKSHQSTALGRSDHLPNDMFITQDKETSVGEVTTINGITVPSTYPLITIPTNTGNTAEGKLFFGIRGRYYIIMENDGTPYFYKRMHDYVVDFQLQPGNLLSYTVDRGGWTDTGKHFFVLMDESFNEIDTFVVQNGYYTDNHDFQLLNDGHALLICRDYQVLDLTDSLEGGEPGVTVIGNHIQELDENKNVVFEWRSWDHLSIADAIHENLTASQIDYVHINSVCLDHDGHILISCRNQSQCIKIDRETGEVIWKLGGIKNQFNFVNDPNSFSYQHMIRPVQGDIGNYTLFDNGNFHDPHSSRAVEYMLDTEEMTAELVWEYKSQTDFASNWMGSTQRLSNGNTLINWGYYPGALATEVTINGDLVYEAFMPPSNASYRTYRYEFDGVADRPHLYYELIQDHITLIFNKFGDTEVDHYKVYIGTTPDEIIPSATTPETRYDITGLENNTTYYFQVSAVGSNGIESVPSDIEEVFVQYYNPGENMIQEGDFNTSSASSAWDLVLADGAVAYLNITPDNHCKLDIENSGINISSIHFQQDGIPLYSGLTYIFEFDAWSEGQRILEAKIVDSQSPFTNYGKIGPIVIHEQEEHFRFTFIMEGETDFDAKVLFELGADEKPVFLDNISLMVDGIPIDRIDQKIDITGEQTSVSYPEPLYSSCTIEFITEEAAKVAMQVFNSNGQLVIEQEASHYSAGKNTIFFERGGLKAGIYFCRLIVESGITKNTYLVSKKITMINP